MNFLIIMDNTFNLVKYSILKLLAETDDEKIYRDGDIGDTIDNFSEIKLVKGYYTESLDEDGDTEYHERFIAIEKLDTEETEPDSYVCRKYLVDPDNISIT